jgi:DNA-binding YbaB/EbfC family protein
LFGGLANLGNILKQAQQMGGRIEEINSSLKSKRVTGSAGGGMVEVEANGFGEVVRLTIDQTLVDRQERDILEDLIPVAVNQAVRKARELHAEEMKSLASGFGVPAIDEALSKITNLDR